MDRNITITTSLIQPFATDEAFPGEAIVAANVILRATELQQIASLKCEINGEYLVAVINSRVECFGVSLDDPANFNTALQDCFHWLFSTVDPFSAVWKYLYCEVTTEPHLTEGLMNITLTYAIRQEERDV